MSHFESIITNAKISCGNIRVSSRKAVNGPVYYSTTVRMYIANKAAQKIYNKHNVQVVAKYNVHCRARSKVPRFNIVHS